MKITLYQRFRNIILYGIIGCCSSSFDFCIYTLLVRLLCIHYLLANCFSVLVGITTSFILNRSYNFKVKDNTGRRFVIFLIIGLCGLMFSNLILYINIDILNWNKLLSKLISIVCVVLLQFLANKYITFRIHK